MYSGITWRRTLLWAFLATMLATVVGSSAFAQSDDGTDDGTGGAAGELAIFGRLGYEDPESGEETAVVGVTIEVEGVGTVVSDDNGEFRIVVPGPGDYLVTLDVKTLPEGVNLRNPDGNPLDVSVNENRDQRVLFPTVLGEADTGGGGTVTFRRFAQLTVEGIKQGLYLAMAAIGLTLIFGTTGLVNFAHAELVTWGMLTTYMFNYYGLAGIIGFVAPLPPPFGGGVGLVFAAVLGMLCGAALGWALNRFIFRGARRAGVSLIAQMVMTIGLSILLRYLMLYFFKGGPRGFADFTGQRAVSLGPVELTQKDLVAMGLSILILLAVASYLEKTRMGKAMRAVSDDRELAESTGIDVERVISLVWMSGAALAATSGVFFGLDQVKWDYGFRILLLVFASVTLGGLGRPYGALVGALVVGLTINLSTLFVDAEVKNMLALLMMTLILMIRPQGILGRAERIG
jgi:branched-chain amino acid transport system permease protein